MDGGWSGASKAAALALVIVWWMIPSPQRDIGPARIDVLSPRGRLSAAPTSIRWDPLREAGFYRVIIEDELRARVVDRVVREGTASRVELSEAERRDLALGGRYSMRISAGDEQAQLVGISPWIELDVVR